MDEIRAFAITLFVGLILGMFLARLALWRKWKQAKHAEARYTHLWNLIRQPHHN